jgi:Prokaryotic Cytochrome C oxidase subunit IV
MMRIRVAVTIVWLLLVMATGIAWLLGRNLVGYTGQATIYISVGLLLAAVFKIVLVTEYFMELRFAPRPLRALALIWICGTAATLIWIYSR